jgi:hypothetical protein
MASFILRAASTRISVSGSIMATSFTPFRLTDIAEPFAAVFHVFSILPYHDIRIIDNIPDQFGAILYQAQCFRPMILLTIYKLESTV